MAKHAKADVSSGINQENLRIKFKGLYVTVDEYFDLLKHVVMEAHPYLHSRPGHPADIATSVAICNEAIFATTEWYNIKWRGEVRSS